MDDRGDPAQFDASREGSRTGRDVPRDGPRPDRDPFDGGAGEPAGDGGADRPGSQSRWRSALSSRWTAVAGSVLVFAGLFVGVRTVDVGAVLLEVRRADPLLLSVAAAIYLLSWPVRGRRYADVLSAIGHRVRTGFCTRAVFVSQTANLALPARAGDAARAVVVSTRGVPYPAGFASLAVERVFDLAAIAALAGLAVATLAVGGDAATLSTVLASGGARTAVLAAGAVTAGALVAGLLVVASARRTLGLGTGLRRRVAGHRWVESALDGVLRFVGDVQLVTRRPRALAAIGVASLLAWGLDVLTAVCVLAALGSGLAPSTLLVVGTLAVSVGNLAKVLPLSQGGIGLYEAAFTALVVGLTPVGAPVALAAAIVDHALKNAVTLAGGVASIGSLGISPFARAAGATRPESRRDGAAAESDRQVFRQA